jgi:hypothetical protein
MSLSIGSFKESSDSMSVTVTGTGWVIVDGTTYSFNYAYFMQGLFEGPSIVAGEGTINGSGFVNGPNGASDPFHVEGPIQTYYVNPSVPYGLSGSLEFDLPPNDWNEAGAAGFSAPISWGTTTPNPTGLGDAALSASTTSFTAQTDSCNPAVGTGQSCALSIAGDEDLVAPANCPPSSPGGVCSNTETGFTASGTMNWSGTRMNVTLQGIEPGGCLEGDGETADGRHFGIYGNYSISGSRMNGSVVIAQTPTRPDDAVCP